MIVIVYGPSFLLSLIQTPFQDSAQTGNSTWYLARSLDRQDFVLPIATFALA